MQGGWRSQDLIPPFHSFRSNCLQDCRPPPPGPAPGAYTIAQELRQGIPSLNSEEFREGQERKPTVRLCP